MEENKAEPEKGWQVPEIVKYPDRYRAEREWRQGPKHRGGGESSCRKCKGILTLFKVMTTV